MLATLVVVLAVQLGISSMLLLVPKLIRAPVWLGLPVGLFAVGAAARLAEQVLGVNGVAAVPAAVLALVTIALWALLRGWSFLAAQILATFCLSALAFVVYALVQTVVFAFNLAWLLTSAILLVFEVSALVLAASYAYEILDVLGRTPNPRQPSCRPPEPARWPLVCIQVPTYSEPIEVVWPTLWALAHVDYPNYWVQVVDNNTTDPALWQPLEEMCRQLGPRFRFMHLENWPGFKAGALNEATRRLPPEVEVVGIVDADYVVKPGFLKAMVPAFEDPSVGFVQSPQNYRDWTDSPYLRGLFQSYRYFFDVTMPARGHRNAIIFCGTMGLIRRSALDEIGGWNPSCVTEDAEASLRLLGHGYRGVYHPDAWGSGLMPLSFDGLKKQRHRWALGGVQILRQHWRELLPGFRHRLRLTAAQRVHYLLGSLQWFGDALMAGFTIILAATALGIALHHRLPVRQLSGAAAVVPGVFLVTGVGRALWAQRMTARCSWGDAVRAMRIWFALSWVVTLACVGGLLRSKAVFLRTPKRREGQASVIRALWSSRTETALVAITLAFAVAMLVAEPSLGFVPLALMLAFAAWVYSSAPWASLAAEGIGSTPLREAQRRSPQTTGERPGGGRALMAVPVGITSAVAILLAAGLLTPPPPQGGSQNLPAILELPTPQTETSEPQLAPLPARLPSPSPSESPSPSNSPSPEQPSPSERPSPPSPSPSEVPSPPSPSPSEVPSPPPTPNAVTIQASPAP